MPPKGGSFILAARAGQFKKKVLSNKALTTRVRSISGKEGSRLTLADNVFDAVTLTANTLDINALANTNGLTNSRIHNMRIWLHANTPADCQLRIIIVQDMKVVQAPPVVADILANTADPFSAYTATAGKVLPYDVSPGFKNLAVAFEVRIIRDFMMPMVLATHTERIARIINIPLHGISSRHADYFICLMSSAAVVCDVQTTTSHTDLDD